MPIRRIVQVKPKGTLPAATLVDDPIVGRLIDSVANSVSQTSSRIKDRAILTVDLAIGANTVNHGLGFRAHGASVCPTVADATFAWSFAVPNDRQVTITVIGAAQPGAAVEVF
jgi:hypothetical protein